MPQFLDGNSLSKTLIERLKIEIGNELEPEDDQPHLVVILVGDNSSSEVYIKKKEEACLNVGIKFTLYHFESTITTNVILNQIKQINKDPTIHGCIVQLPLPKHIDEDAVIYSLSPSKDVDGFHPTNIGNMILNRPNFLPATPYGIQLLLDHYKIYTEGKHIVILGKSMIVGQPLMNLLSNEKGARGTVTCCDRYTRNLDQLIKLADILIVATGKHNIIQHQDQIKEGVVIIDVGIHRFSDKTKKCGYRLEGDVNFEAVKNKCSYITPVPGGVGPMTVVSLLLNTWKAYKNN